MKKICIVTTISMTLEAFVVGPAFYLSQNGFDVTLVCSHDEAFAAKLPEALHYHGIAIERGMTSPAKLMKTVKELKKFFKQEQFDLVQYSTPNAAFCAAWAAKAVGVPVRLYCQWGIAYVGAEGAKRKMMRYLERKICQWSTDIQPDSNGNLLFSVKEQLYLPEKGHVVGAGSACGVDLKKFSALDKPDWRQELRQQLEVGEAFLFGFVGRVDRDKGFDELLMAYYKLREKRPEVKLIIVGSEDKAQTVNQKLYEMSKEDGGVIYCGQQSEVGRYFAAMDALLLPSYREGFGSVVIEAQAMRVPVVVSDIPGPTDAVENEVTGLVVPKGDAVALSEAMERLAGNSALCEKLSRAAYRGALEHYDSEVVFQQILQNRNWLLEGKQEGQHA